ncbi:CFEM domain-containing, partial [Fusarium albosuccineum]
MTAPRSLLVLGVLCLLGLGSAQSPSDAPLCGTTCALRFLSLPDYADKTQEQLCHDKGFSRLMSDCVKEACTVRETLTFANISSTACRRPALDRRMELQLTSLIMTGLAGLFFVVRLASKIHGLASWGADDSLIVASFILLIPTIIMIQLAIPQGVGLDIWVLTDGQITAYLKSLFIFQIFYALTLTLIKASILFFFLRIFPDHKFRIAVWLTLACDLLLGVATFILTLIQRDPLRLVWEGWKDKVPRGVVFDAVKLAMGHGIIHIALDVWMLILPLTQLYSIGLKLRKKIGVIAMFSIGVFLTFVSVVKFVVFLQFLKSPDSASVSVANTALWCCIELC